MVSWYMIYRKYGIIIKFKEGSYMKKFKIILDKNYVISILFALLTWYYFIFISTDIDFSPIYNILDFLSYNLYIIPLSIYILSFFSFRFYCLSMRTNKPNKFVKFNKLIFIVVILSYPVLMITLMTLCVCSSYTSPQ